MMELSALPTGLRASRLVRKVDKPRPLKLPLNQNRLSNIEGKYGAFEEIMAMTEAVSGNIANGNHDSMLQHSIMTLCSHLKKYGPQLETVFKDQLDRAFLSFRNGSRDEHLDVASRLHLLEVIELRTRNWSSCEDTNNYYKQHIVEHELLPLTDMAALLSMSPTMLGPVASPTTPQPPLLSPGEIIKTSGKFGKPTKIPGKNYCKDEVVIRNSDSGKVMGIKGRRVHMIEELSETIISFQRVLPGAKERLVQITGPNEGRINDAKLLIEDTIRRNASPVRVETAPEKEGMGGSSSSLNSSASDESNRFTQAGSRRSVLHHSFSTNDASIGEYKYTVTVGHDTLKITGTNLELVKEAKLLLDDYYSGERGGYGSPDNFLTSYEEEPRTPSAVTPAVPKLTAGSRLSSLDSGATSESDETYKAPPSTCAVSSPPRTQVAASQGQASSKLNAPAVVRYERDELLDLCTQAIAHGNYREYDLLVKHFPDMMPKCQKMFDPQSYVAKWKEMGAMASVVLSSSDSPDVE